MIKNMQLKRWAHQAISQLKNCKNSAQIDIELLLMMVLGVNRAYLLAHPERTLTSDEIHRLAQLLARRKAGEPMAYILQHKEFWSMGLLVNKNVLIPRPETELVVEIALEKLPTKEKIKIVDLGTGSGAVALALARECPYWQITAVDFSSEALIVAEDNAKHLHISNIQFIQSDWFSALQGRKFHAIVSNPPYIAENDPHLMQGDVRFEPRIALSAGIDGLEAIRKIVHQAPHYLLPEGYLIFEHGCRQGAAIIKMMQAAGFQYIEHYKDLAGFDRVIIGKFI